MKITPVHSIKEYDGPKSHRAIIFKIQEDARNENRVELPLSYIEAVLTSFFSFFGIIHYFRKFQSFAIPGLGRWSLNQAGRKARKKHKKYLVRSKRKSMRIYMRKYRKRKRILRKLAAKKVLTSTK